MKRFSLALSLALSLSLVPGRAISISDLIGYNPNQFPQSGNGYPIASVIVNQQPNAGLYILTNTWNGTNTSSRIASTFTGWSWDLAGGNGVPWPITIGSPGVNRYGSSTLTVNVGAVSLGNYTNSGTNGLTLFFGYTNVAGAVVPMTNYIGATLDDAAPTIWASYQKVDSGTLWLGEVVCDTNSIVSIKNYPPPTALPSSDVADFIERLNRETNNQPVYIFGDSISEAVPGPFYGTVAPTNGYWWQQVFLGSNSAAYAMPGYAKIQLTNYAVGASGSMMGLAFLVGDFEPGALGGSSNGLVRSFQNGNGGTIRGVVDQWQAYQNGGASTSMSLYEREKPFIQNKPSLGIWAYGSNYNQQDDGGAANVALQWFRDHDVPAIISTSHRQLTWSTNNYIYPPPDFPSSPSSADVNYSFWCSNGNRVKKTADHFGAALVDTWSRIDAWGFAGLRQGQTNAGLLYADYVHMGSAGTWVTADAYRATLNNLRQTPRSVGKGLGRVEFYPGQEPFFPTAATWVFNKADQNAGGVQGPWDPTVNPWAACLGFGTNSSVEAVINAQNQYVQITLDPDTSEIWLMVDGQPGTGITNYTATVTIPGVVTKTTTVRSGSSTRMRFVQLDSVSDLMEQGRTNVYPSGTVPGPVSLQFKVTAVDVGSTYNLPIVAFVGFHPRHTEVPQWAWYTNSSGGWSYTTGWTCDQYCGSPSSDTSGAMISWDLPETYDALVAVVHTGQAGGKLNGYFDGRTDNNSYLANFDTYGNGTAGVASLWFIPNYGAGSFAPNQWLCNRQRHVVSLSYNGTVNASAVGGGATNGVAGNGGVGSPSHRLWPLQVWLEDLR